MTDQRPTTIFDTAVIGEWEDECRLQAYLDEVGDVRPQMYSEVEERLRHARVTAAFDRTVPAWKHATHFFGFVQDDGHIEPASAIEPDLNLQRVDIRLDRLRVFDYPGKGRHFVLLAFKATNSLEDDEEQVAFSQTYLIHEGESAGVAGYPIFFNLSVGRRGANFEVGTVNVKNERDERVLAFMDSGPFNNGLELLTTAQPAIAPLTAAAQGIVKFLLNRRKNVPVQKFFLGLDTDVAPSGARLREGSYIAVQAPELDWNEWRYNIGRGIVEAKNSPGTDLPFNYLIFRVVRSV